jgi:hypothetical protein
MDYNISIPDIYSKSNKTEIPLLKTIELYFHTKDEYDIIINDEKYNHLKNTKKNIIINFSDIQKYYRISTSKIMSKITPIFHVKTNCNNLLWYEFDIGIGLNTEYYKLFDGFTNLLEGYIDIIFNKNNKLYGSIHNKYVKLYFYYYDNNVYNKFCVDYYSLKNISYGFKFISKKNYFVNFLKYFTINGFILNNDIIDKIDNSIIYIKLLHNKKNKLDIACIINIIETDKTFMLIFTPIKIIDNINYCEIKIFDNKCNECEFNKHKNLNKYYSKFLFMCKKHYDNLEKKIISLFEDVDDNYKIDGDNLLLILKEKYNIYNLKKNPQVYTVD